MSRVYVAVGSDGRHKIGVTGNLRLRMYHLSRDLGLPVRLVYDLQSGGNPVHIETTAHWFLADCHTGGEWFDVSAAEAIAAVQSAASRVLAGYVPKIRLVVAERYGVPSLMLAKIDAALVKGEARSDFIRVAVEAELARRAK